MSKYQSINLPVSSIFQAELALSTKARRTGSSGYCIVPQRQTYGTLPHNAISKTFSMCRLDITLKNMSVKSCVCEECAKNAFQAESKLGMTPRKMKVRSHTKSTVGTNMNGTEMKV